MRSRWRECLRPVSLRCSAESAAVRAPRSVRDRARAPRPPAVSWSGRRGHLDNDSQYQTSGRGSKPLPGTGAPGARRVSAPLAARARRVAPVGAPARRRVPALSADVRARRAARATRAPARPDLGRGVVEQLDEARHLTRAPAPAAGGAASSAADGPHVGVGRRERRAPRSTGALRRADALAGARARSRRRRRARAPSARPARAPCPPGSGPRARARTGTRRSRR